MVDMNFKSFSIILLPLHNRKLATKWLFIYRNFFPSSHGTFRDISEAIDDFIFIAWKKKIMLEKTY